MNTPNKKLWFKRKNYGWGWVPCTWEGWLVIFIYIASLFSYEYYIRSVEPDGNFLVGVIFPVFILTSILIAICYKKGEKPKWQWGENKEYTKIGVGVMIWKDGKVLLGKRKTVLGEGEYAFPGGHVEFMEGFQDCVHREVLEECGLKIKNLKFILLGNTTLYAPKHYITVGFSADLESGEPQLLEPDKCESWNWYDLDNLPEPLFVCSKELAESYKTGINFIDK